MESIWETPSWETVHKGSAIWAFVRKHIEASIFTVLIILGASGYKLYEREQIQRAIISEMVLQILSDKKSYASLYPLPLSQISEEVWKLVSAWFSADEVLKKLKDKSKIQE